MDNFILMQFASQRNATIPGYYQWIEVWRKEQNSTKWTGTWVDAPGKNTLRFTELKNTDNEYEPVHIRDVEVSAKSQWEAVSKFRIWEAKGYSRDWLVSSKAVCPTCNSEDFTMPSDGEWRCTNCDKISTSDEVSA